MSTILGDALDNPVWKALSGPHAAVCERAGNAARYPADMAPFGALADGASADVFEDAAKLSALHPLVLVDPPIRPPGEWRVLERLSTLQMVATDLEGAPDPAAEILGPGSADEMLALVDRTRPGPFRRRTVELGTYLGFRHDGALVAMAGERFRLPGWTEVSAVCTDEAFRGTGMGTLLVLAVVAHLRSRGDRALLHVASENERAIRLYLELGFVVRRELEILITAPPQSEAALDG